MLKIEFGVKWRMMLIENAVCCRRGLPHYGVDNVTGNSDVPELDTGDRHGDIRDFNGRLECIDQCVEFL